jgi:phosphate transport system substrate-binding protein
VFAILCAGLFAPGALRGEALRIQGSSIVAQALLAAAPTLKKEHGIELKILPEGGSTTAIHVVGSDGADVAMTTRPLAADDRSAYPEKRFFEEFIGLQVLVFIVPRELWDAGVRSLTKEQAAAIYERQLTDWKKVGGPDQALKFFNPQSGRGVWELFVTWVYGDIRKAPLGKGLEVVRGGRETRNAVQFTAGSMSITTPRWADARTVFALPVPDDKGTLIEPTLENFQTQRYPIFRPLYLVVGDRPTGQLKKFLDFMVSPAGQEFVTKAEFIPAKEPKAIEG